MNYHFKASGDSTIFTQYSDNNGSGRERIPDTVIPTSEVVSLAPLVINDMFAANALVPYAAPNGRLYSTPFIVNGIRYIPLAGNLCIAMV
jgi:hypothetical protein